MPLLLAGCGLGGDDKPIVVSVIGPAPKLADRARHPLEAPAALLTDATAQGLVAFDASGQTEPALAERWTVSNNGLSIIFRLSDVDWADGRPVEAADVARRLKLAIAQRSRNPYLPITGAITDIVAVTPQVVDVRLSSPRPNLLQLFAQPEFAVMQDDEGSGPYLASVAKDGAIVLRPRVMQDPEADPGAPLQTDADTIRLRGERVAAAVVRFAMGRSDGVLGGRFVDLPIAHAASELPPGALRFDPATGLFGLTFAEAPSDSFIGTPTVRRALAMAIDREALVAAFDAPGWQPETRLIGGDVADLPMASEPDWADQPLDTRRTDAAASIAIWRSAHGEPPALRVALPDGPGSRLVFARLAQDWRALGVAVTRVAADAPADLRLVDQVAPGEIASWYLRRFACAMKVPCTSESDRALIAARNAPTLAERTVMLREADRLITQNVPYIALARPLRWSLVGRRMTGWRESPRAFHPARHLRADRDRR
ncbi:ABC transporter substrate-binding protein [Sphingomonas quercus]|nr:ABC transporter substrate-binding protein [Sphingomonas quercus]